VTVDSSFSISGAECVDALCCEGFKVAARRPGSTTVIRGLHVIVVPDVVVMPPSVLDAILEEADISSRRFFALLADEPTSLEVVFDEA
jgi:hypothetical protein